MAPAAIDFQRKIISPKKKIAVRAAEIQSFASEIKF